MQIWSLMFVSCQTHFMIHCFEIKQEIKKEVYDYVMDKPETQEFIVKLKDYCDFVFSQYEKQNKSHMIVAIGCTGGQHRSVSICNWLYDEYKDTYRCFKSHRDIGVDEE